MIAYAISDPTTLHFDDRFPKDLAGIAEKANWLLYRDKENPDYRRYAGILSEAVREFFPLRLIIHDDYQLADTLGAYGVHFSASGVTNLAKAKERGLFTIASTHSLKEALQLEKEGIDVVTLSPIFATPGKGTPLGTAYLAEAVRQLQIPVIALGGITDQARIEAVKLAGVSGFASIRFFSR